jgi:hypothetical protein
MSLFVMRRRDDISGIRNGRAEWLLAIGKRLQREYDENQQLPARLLGLVQQLEAEPESEPRAGVRGTRMPRP